MSQLGRAEKSELAEWEARLTDRIRAGQLKWSLSWPELLLLVPEVASLSYTGENMIFLNPPKDVLSKKWNGQEKIKK